MHVIFYMNCDGKISDEMDPSPIINSLAPGKSEWCFTYVIFKWILMIDGWGISCEITLIWMSLYFTDE